MSDHLGSVGSDLTMPIPLSLLLPIKDQGNYKVHLASKNEVDQPLDVFVRDREEWDGWNTWRSSRDEFNRPYILSLIDFYHERDAWLFGGIYRVVSRSPVQRAASYQVEPVPQFDNLTGRLKVCFARPGRGRSIMLERYFDQMTVLELLREPYSGERFPGYEKISHRFAELETIFQTNRSDWKAALESVKGVYLIVDESNGKKYVGSAYGGDGVWARWGSYIGTGHGWTDELTRVIKREGIDYARRNFRMSLLEFYPAKIEDRIVIEREGFWKEALLTRSAFGYNKN